MPWESTLLHIYLDTFLKNSVAIQKTNRHGLQYIGINRNEMVLLWKMIETVLLKMYFAAIFEITFKDEQQKFVFVKNILKKTDNGNGRISNIDSF